MFSTLFLLLSLNLLLPLRISGARDESFGNGTAAYGGSTRSNTIDRRKIPEDSESGEFEGISSPVVAAAATPIRCISCVREEIKYRSIQVIKSEVLKKLGFENPPNISGKVLPKVPSQVLSMVLADTGDGYQGDQPQFHGSYADEEDDFHVKTEKVIVFAQTYPRLRHWKGHDILHFSFSDSTSKYHVANASLYVFIKGADRRPNPIITLEIFKLYKTDVSATLKMISRKITQPYGVGDWFRLDVTGMVSEWLKNPDENLGFIINGTSEGKKFAILDRNESDKKVPYVEISTKQSKRKIRRNLMDCNEGSNERVCCRYPLMIDFESFGWDFIIAPKKYDAHYCAGDCDPLTLQRFPHTHITNMAAPHVATPCCAPRKFSPINMLYFDEDMNVVYGTLPSMVVDRCGCT